VNVNGLLVTLAMDDQRDGCLCKSSVQTRTHLACFRTNEIRNQCLINYLINLTTLYNFLVCTV